MELLTNLGIDWRLFIAQVVNFIILLVLLQRFLYKPLVTMLDTREARLKKGLDLTDTMEVKAQRMEEERAEVVRAARSEAERIVGTALADAETSRMQMITQSREEAARIVAEGKTILLEQQRLVVEAAKKEIATLVVDATRKVMGELTSNEPDTNQIAKAIERLGRTT